MKRTRQEKAITLIALIITIVVLLILAVVAINAVTGDGIIQHATNAKTSYEKAQDEEQDILSYYGEYLENKGDVGPWKQKGDEMIKTNADGTTVKLKIGDVIRYNPIKADDGSNVSASYTSLQSKNYVREQVYNVTEYTNWKVLGVDNGRILLVSGDIVDDFEIVGKNQALYAFYGVDELNNISSIYGRGKGALKARSFNETDAEKLLGYTREELIKKSNDYINGTNILKYGEKVTYTKNVDSGVIAYKVGDVGEFNDFVTGDAQKVLHYVEGKEAKKIQPGEIKTFESKYYGYCIGVTACDEKGMILTTEEKYNILFKNGTDDINKYWIADVNTYSDILISNLRQVYNLKCAGVYTRDDGIKVGDLASIYPRSLIGEAYEYGVRVVVELENDVNLSYDETNKEWKIN